MAKMITVYTQKGEAVEMLSCDANEAVEHCDYTLEAPKKKEAEKTIETSEKVQTRKGSRNKRK